MIHCNKHSLWTYSQTGWSMSCKETFPIRHPVERHRHLLTDNLPFTSINDHKILTYVLNVPAKTCVISVTVRDRMKRWEEYLRSFTFDTVHIPISDNHFCDLLSRNGCVTVVTTWKSVKHGMTSGDDLVPNIARTQWPTPEHITTGWIIMRV